MPADYYWRWHDDFGYDDYDAGRFRIAEAVAELVALLEK